MKYFYNFTIAEIELPEQGYKVGTDITEIDTFIALTDEQLVFLADNPTASVMEVWNKRLNPAPEPPTPEQLFDWDKCSRELYGVLSETRQIQLHSWQFTIVQLMQVKNFTKLKSTIDVMYSVLQLITLEEKELFYSVMLDNGIDLNNY